MEKVKVETEKVDDVPLILHIESEMGIATIINEVIKPHPNRKGLSIGAMIIVDPIVDPYVKIKKQVGKRYSPFSIKIK
jgi:hypothetical protein